MVLKIEFNGKSANMINYPLFYCKLEMISKWVVVILNALNVNKHMCTLTLAMKMT